MTCPVPMRARCVHAEDRPSSQGRSQFSRWNPPWQTGPLSRLDVPAILALANQREDRIQRVEVSVEDLGVCSVQT